MRSFRGGHPHRHDSGPSSSGGGSSSGSGGICKAREPGVEASAAGAGAAAAGPAIPPHDEALRRWADAKASDKEHTYFGMRPLENDAKGEAVAIATMLMCFS